MSRFRTPTGDDGVADDAHETGVLAFAEEDRLEGTPRGVELDALILHDLRGDRRGRVERLVSALHCPHKRQRRRHAVAPTRTNVAFRCLTRVHSEKLDLMLRAGAEAPIPVQRPGGARTFAAMVWPRHVPRKTRP